MRVGGRRSIVFAEARGWGDWFGALTKGGEERNWRRESEPWFVMQKKSGRMRKNEECGVLVRVYVGGLIGFVKLPLHNRPPCSKRARLKGRKSCHVLVQTYCSLAFMIDYQQYCLYGCRIYH